jgi:glutamate carboxypeptidase
MDAWVEAAAAEIAGRAERELEALVGVSSPSGDVRGAEEVLAIVGALVPDGAEVERLACSSPGHAPDFVARMRGTGRRRLVLLGHVDTVIAHGDHRPLVAEGDRLTGSGAVDMKGGDVLALGVLRALARSPELYAEVALLLVCDEEWRTAPFRHTERFAAFDACLCFEAGQTGPGGEDEVVVRRKAAGTLLVSAHGRSAHSGSAPDRGANALVALAEAARAVAAEHDPAGDEHLTAVPTVMHAGDAFNVVPASGELTCDLRADSEASFDRVLAALPVEVGGARLSSRMLRVWPGMDARAATPPALEHASALLGRPILGGARGGASDASHMATAIPLTIDGLGARGGGAHAPEEHVARSSLRPRAEVALALALAVLDGGG